MNPYWNHGLSEKTSELMAFRLFQWYILSKIQRECSIGYAAIMAVSMPKSVGMGKGNVKNKDKHDGRKTYRSKAAGKLAGSLTGKYETKVVLTSSAVALIFPLKFRRRLHDSKSFRNHSRNHLAAFASVFMAVIMPEIEPSSSASDSLGFDNDVKTASSIAIITGPVNLNQGKTWHQNDKW